MSESLAAWLCVCLAVGPQTATARRLRSLAVTSPVWPGSAVGSVSPPAGPDAASLHRPPPPFSCAASATPGRPETSSPSVHVSTVRHDGARGGGGSLGRDGMGCTVAPWEGMSSGAS